ncbi:MAG: hypothetical protein A2V70_02305 [Planctomycetes bacterium RBG_13_63_9]|nr:MAG: hypothetical protein A2V70_02305 [Planctomycetes bacterium RBG_13_63_9]
MRCWLRILLVLTLISGVGVAAWWYSRRGVLSRQWHCYRVASAESFKDAQREIAWFESGPDRPARLTELARKWGTGNRPFDLFLAQHLRDAASSELLRETFSKELGRRDGMLSRWAHYWSYQATSEPDRQIASIRDFFDTLAATEHAQAITWREVLDLQAVFTLAGEPQHAHGLSPENWRQRYRTWQQNRPARFPHLTRPERPFADWPNGHTRDK